MRHILTLTSCTLLAACAAAPRDIALAGLDLNNPSVIAQVSEGLPRKQRAALATYALLHWPQSKAYCGRPVFKGAAEPRTVGEAIDKTIEFDTALARKRIEEQRPPSIFERRARDHQRLVDEFEELTLEREMLATEELPPVEKQKRLEELDRKLADNRAVRNRSAAEPAL